MSKWTLTVVITVQGKTREEAEQAAWDALDDLDYYCVGSTPIPYDGEWLPEAWREACAEIDYSDDRPHHVVRDADGWEWATDGHSAYRTGRTAAREAKFAGVGTFNPRGTKAEPGPAFKTPSGLFTIRHVGTPTVQAKYVDLAVRLFGDRIEWRASGDVAPVFGLIDGRAVAVIMPWKLYKDAAKRPKVSP